jgi:predicted MFS family arabinose efflux permease
MSSQVAASRPPLLTRPLVLVFVASFGSSMGFYLLLSVVTLYASSLNAGGYGVGFATGALMLSTVAAELGTPRLMARFGYRLTFAAGMLLLGAPALALIAATTLPAILAVSLVRGVGFAIAVVLGNALVAEIVPPERRGEGLGLYGVVVSVPAVVALPLGLWLAGHVGFPFVFVLGAVVVLAGLAVVPGLPARAKDVAHPVGMLAGLRMPRLVRPALTFGAVAMTGGIVVTFLPLAVTQASGNLAAVALLIQAAVTTGTRWWAGRQADRHSSAVLLIAGVFAAAVGILALLLYTNPVAVIAGMVVFGAGFGVAQNASLTLMFERVAPSGYGTVSALWNLAFDAGIGIGATGFGVVAAQTGYATAFLLTGAVMLAALAPAWYERGSARVRQPVL